MKVLTERNVHTAFARGNEYLQNHSVRRESRNGPVLVATTPVTTVYERPLERVIFWPERDANPFFHLYESLWMLAGRNDVAPLTRYVKRQIEYSDDGVTQWGAYGHRWRREFGADQLEAIAQRLRQNPDDRRCVLQMWDAVHDLGKMGKDVPCNMTATFQRGADGELNLVVFCRSNDMIWGAYGANAVQFATLLEYMAAWIGCPVGTYTQVSVNFHAYESIFDKTRNILPDYTKYLAGGHIPNPYDAFDPHHSVHPVPMPTGISIKELDSQIEMLLEDADCLHSRGVFVYDGPWFRMVDCVLRSHSVYKTSTRDKRFEAAFAVLAEGDQKADWIVAARQWFTLRLMKETNGDQK